MQRTFACATLLLALAACGSKAPTTSSATPTAASEAAATPAPPAPAAPKAAAVKVSEKNDLYEFSYAYPAQAAAIPALKAQFDADMARQKADIAKDASDGKKDAKDNDYPFNPYFHSTEWKVVTDLPGWLSLSTLLGLYTGGAHPNYAFDALLWDKAANRRVDALALFTSKAALAQAVTKPFCAALAKGRLKKRGEVWQGDGISDFEQCIDPLDQTVILGSAGRQGFDRIGFLIAPYNAGPYAEGSYEVTLPVTPAVLAAVKPEYRAAFVGG
ncbi:DUF4163 domain-containing protein [Novosphingobium percolationis]|uniref:DUF4163 domain-containing protein n=1 Tax=Novosphingobium percolationis TaxID=2871811 RepID=UPI001CD749C2|nr:DUF4163 domain-containing protein [Novosphingobium percolationis]